MKPNRTKTLVLILVVGLSVLNLWAWSVLNAQQSMAEKSSQDSADCSQLAQRIKQLKDKPMVAGSHEIELTELSKRIEQAAADSQLPSSSIIRISPESARRAGDSLYLEKPTTVLLDAVSLEQLAQFLYKMSTGPAAMNVQALRISAPREEETGGRWTAEVTLSYLIYAPKQDVAAPEQTM